MRVILEPDEPKLFNLHREMLHPSAFNQLDDNWPGLMRRTLLGMMPPEESSKKLYGSFDRPSKELYSMAGLIFLMETFNWTRQEAAEHYMYGTRTHYALNLPPNRQYVCVRRLEGYLKQFRESELAQRIFEEVTAALIYYGGKRGRIKARRQKQESEAFKTVYRKRSGIEGTMNEDADWAGSECVAKPPSTPALCSRRPDTTCSRRSGPSKSGKPGPLGPIRPHQRCPRPLFRLSTSISGSSNTSWHPNFGNHPLALETPRLLGLLHNPFLQGNLVS